MENLWAGWTEINISVLDDGVGWIMLRRPSWYGS